MQYLQISLNLVTNLPIAMTGPMHIIRNLTTQTLTNRDLNICKSYEDFKLLFRSCMHGSFFVCNGTCDINCEYFWSDFTKYNRLQNNLLLLRVIRYIKDHSWPLSYVQQKTVGYKCCDEPKKYYNNMLENKLTVHEKRKLIQAKNNTIYKRNYL